MILPFYSNRFSMTRISFFKPGRLRALVETVKAHSHSARARSFANAAEGNLAPSRCPIMRATRALKSISASAGFTLVELLVVIFVVGVLIALLLPSLGKARTLAKQTREQAAAAQMMVAFIAYADDNKGLILPGYPKREWVNGPMPVFNGAGARLLNEDAQRYPFRLAPYLNYNFRGLYQSDRLLADLREKESEYLPSGINYDYVVSLYPSLGLNAVFVGGSDRLLMFDRLFQNTFGRVHVARLDQVVRASSLLTFVSARAQEQPAVPILGKPEGFFRVDPPRFASNTANLWDNNYETNAALPGINSGFISLRYNGKAVCGYLDGHVGLLGWSGLNDMRNWADQADSAGWTVRPR